MSTLLCYDSITATDITAHAECVMGYVDGPFKWSDTDWARFHTPYRIRVATRWNTNDGHLIDCEKGDATPAQAVQWVLNRRTAGATYSEAGIYCGMADVPLVMTAWRHAVPTGEINPPIFVAHYDNVAELPAGYVGKQYIDPPMSGGHYDKSMVSVHWLSDLFPVKEFDMQLTDRLDPNPAQGTVGEALGSVLFGIPNVRDAGALALQIHNVEVKLNNLTDLVTQLLNKESSSGAS